jgi:hypothetical protein
MLLELLRRYQNVADILADEAAAAVALNGLLIEKLAVATPGRGEPACVTAAVVAALDDEPGPDAVDLAGA